MLSLFQIIAALLTLAAVFGFLNERYLRLPTTIGIMAITLVFSVVLVILQETGFPLMSEWAAGLISAVDFDETLLHGILSFLLFAGALHIDLDDLAEQKWAIALLATFGMLTSAFLVGAGLWLLLALLGNELPFIYCLLFGAIISPTDPIAVLAILKSIGAPKPLYTKIAGESLFNDGIAVVVFLTIAGIAVGHQEATATSVTIAFLKEAVGGIALGLASGWVALQMLRRLDNYQVEVLITLALVSGAYALAMSLHMSGPLAVVIAGLLIGNHGRRLAMSEQTVGRLDTFWEMIDEILNATLFLMIGLEMLVIAFTGDILLAGALAIPLVLLARSIAVGIPISLLRLFREFTPRPILALTWGGLRGGISVALALSLPISPERDLLVGITYIVVVFSILVQGLTVGRLIGGRR